MIIIIFLSFSAAYKFYLFTSKTICKLKLFQFRGVTANTGSYTGAFAIMGSVDPESFDTLHSFSNAFEMPFVTPWFPEKNTGK